MNRLLQPLLKPAVPVIRYVWHRIPEPWQRARAIHGLGVFMYEHYVRDTYRSQSHYTWFLRNLPQLEVLRDQLANVRPGSTVRVASVGCSVGAELYSTLYVLRKARPDLRFVAVGTDLSETVVDIARKGRYRLNMPADIAGCLDVEGTRVFTTQPDALGDMMEVEPDGEHRIRSWLQQDVRWTVGDATSPALRDALGTQDVVLACNFLGPMDDATAEACLRNLARLLAPGGVLVLDGVDLALKTRIVLELGLVAVTERIEEIHLADPTKRDWPWTRWAHEPFDRQRPDWSVRYATVFRVPGGAQIGDAAHAANDGHTSNGSESFVHR